MELLQLKYFITVAKMEHISKAAQELHIAQPALSMMIGRLEKELGVKLFDRKGRRIILNSYGQAFLKKANLALTLLDEGKREIENMIGLDKGTISLSTSSLLRFNDLLGSFISKYTEVNFKITQTLEQGSRINLLESNEIDFSLASPPIEKQGISGVNLFTDRFCLCVPVNSKLAKKKTISLKEAKDQAFISFKNGTSAREMHETFCRDAGFSPNVNCEVEEGSAIISLIKSGLGVALIPMPRGSMLYQDEVVFLNIDEPICERTIQLSWNTDRYLSKAAETFKEFTIEYFKRVYGE